VLYTEHHVYISVKVFMIHSYSDKAFFFTTCDNDQYCSMDATVTLLYCRVSNCSLSYVYTLLGTMSGSWKISFGSRKVLELF